MVANRVTGVRPSAGRVRRVPPSHWSKTRCYRIYALMDASEGWTFYDNFLPWNLTFYPQARSQTGVYVTASSYLRRFVCAVTVNSRTSEVVGYPPESSFQTEFEFISPPEMD
ncbi:hypothetical protein AVEN_248670-1 [Araneus ventricosus]|uniref:Uncharacterized protein n=1 Tax=Araneus ventricosus TaxID=182803 RepID=A0A4Y2C0W6_ARAVE|nr:hypothetical protein AVEN_248670-1 [Araneus ventricosus]